MLLKEDRLTVNYDLITLNRDDLTSVLVYEILDPGLQDTRRKLAANTLAEISLVDLHLVSKTENLKNIFIGLITNRAQHRGHRKLLLAVDVRVHDIVYVRGKLNP